MNSTSRFRSLRWSLPASYALIALIAVVILGITLLGTLRGYYQAQELVYLRRNASAIADEITPLLLSGDQPALQAQITAYSFLTQARVQVLDEEGQEVLADSGKSGAFIPEISVNTGGAELLGTARLEENVTIVIEEEQQIENGAISNQRVITRTSLLPAQGSLFGFTLGAGPTAVAVRSGLVEEETLVDESGQVAGRLRLSQGPAYGQDILRSVAAGWALAGMVAVLLAALSGWLVSRRLTKPLLELTAVTGRMAGGDLGARAAVTRVDEVGLLGDSFNRMAEQVESTVNSLRQFTADSAHELHTPLTALQTDLQLLAAGADPAQQQWALRAQGQARRMQELADSLLELSRLEAERAPDEWPLLNLTALAQTAGELVASQAEQIDLEFALKLPAEPIMVQGDEVQLQRALTNVLENSLKFTPPPGRIELALVREGETAVLTVRDSGIGIPAADLPQLFNRFHRGRNTAAFPGSGLGLAIVHKIMLRHNGRVVVHSGETGTEVRLSLPIEGVQESR